LFNELALNPEGRPHNPMVNAGAIMTTSLIRPDLDIADRFDHVAATWRRLTGGRIGFNNAVYLSERQTADRNFAQGLWGPDAVGALISLLFPLATVVMPNLPEAQKLTGLDTEDRHALAERLVAMGATALVTGGHGAEPVDHLFDRREHVRITVPRYPVAATHGAGCTHSAALAAGLAAGLTLADAVAHGPRPPATAPSAQAAALSARSNDS
jgi:sugar/nucleoside kinase (ribokinase family)